MVEVVQVVAFVIIVVVFVITFVSSVHYNNNNIARYTAAVLNAPRR